MKQNRLSFVLAASLGLSVVHAAGPLMPPGPPGPTMKSAQEIFDEAAAAKTAAEAATSEAQAALAAAQAAQDPRTPITSVPVTLSAAGSYYLASDLTYSGTDTAIEISASDVTLDFNGFTLRSTGTDGIGVEILSGRDRCAIEGGVIVGFDQGLSARSPNVLVISEMRIAGAGGTGIKASGSVTALTVRHCTISGSADDGLFVGEISFSPTSSGTIVTGLVVEHTTITDCAGKGIRVQERHDAGEHSGIVIENCRIAECAEEGIHVSNLRLIRGMRVENCEVVGTGAEGIQINANPGNVRGLVIRANTVSRATNVGIQLLATLGALVENNRVSSTVANGSGASIGIQTVLGSENLIIRNTCFYHTDNYSLSGTDLSGPEVGGTGAIGSTHPWANFGINSGL